MTYLEISNKNADYFGYDLKRKIRKGQIKLFLK